LLRSCESPNKELKKINLNVKNSKLIEKSQEKEGGWLEN